MLIKYGSAAGDQYFVPPGYGFFPGGNVFTLIVGKNGTGKSRMLRNIALHYIEGYIPTKNFEREERVRIELAERFEVSGYNEPSKVICVSTSPFDRFPVLRRNEWSSRYSYLGLRGLPTGNLSLSYMSRIMGALISAVSRDSGRLQSLANILNYLGYEPVMKATFFLGMASATLEAALASSDPVSMLRETYTQPSIFPASAEISYSLKSFQEASPIELNLAMSILQRFVDHRRKPRVDIELNPDGLIANSELRDDELMLLLRCGFLRLKEVTLRKKTRREAFRIGDASSGEQSVVMSLLGIGSQIEDGALVCIDEPEVCLHPEWQERYVHLLISTFEDYKNCQFLIATHSPQIVAELPGANCFVTNMETKEVHSAKEVSKRSIDFQLANVFGTPGFGNEYLARIALNTFLKVGKAKAFDDSDRDSYRLLKKLSSKIDGDDPLNDLIVALEEMFSIYG